MNVSSATGGYGSLSSQAVQRKPETVSTSRSGPEKSAQSGNDYAKAQQPAPTTGLDGGKLGRVLNARA